jgi:phage shock protein C
MQRINRSNSERIISGVCGGVAKYFGIDPTIVRLVWVFFTLFGGAGLLAYIIAAIMIPDELAQSTSINFDSIKNNPLWGVLLILIGIILFFRYDHILFMVWDTFWDNLLNVFLVMSLVGVGLYFLYSKTNEAKEVNSNDKVWELLHLSILDKKLAGVCGGFGQSLNIDPTIVRILWVFGTFMSIGVGVLLYIFLALVLPERTITPKDI